MATFLVHGSTPNHVQLSKRMKQALGGVSQIAGDEYHLLPYNDRLGISVPFGWASEVIPYFSYREDGNRELVEFHIWPANTKQEGYIVFAKPLNWIIGESLAIDGSDYELGITYEVKLCHWNRYVASILYSDNDVVMPLHTRDNFFSQSGKWECEKWKDLEHLFDEHFRPDFNWREKCKWDENFTNTDRGYLRACLNSQVGRFWA